MPENIISSGGDRIEEHMPPDRVDRRVHRGKVWLLAGSRVAILAGAVHVARVCEATGRPDRDSEDDEESAADERDVNRRNRRFLPSWSGSDFFCRVEESGEILFQVPSRTR
jgi:hypothetical protein